MRNLEQDPLTQARVTERDWENWKRYDRFVETAEHTISRTNTGKTPWAIIEGADANYRSLTVGRMVRDELSRRVGIATGIATAETDEKKKKPKGREPGDRKKAAARQRPPTVLSALDMTPRLTKQDYLTQLRELQARLHSLHLAARESGMATVM